jgi:hypothetical protein
VGAGPPEDFGWVEVAVAEACCMQLLEEACQLNEDAKRHCKVWRSQSRPLIKRLQPCCVCRAMIQQSMERELGSVSQLHGLLSPVALGPSELHPQSCALPRVRQASSTIAQHCAWQPYQAAFDAIKDRSILHWSRG